MGHFYIFSLVETFKVQMFIEKSDQLAEHIL